ncbi:hypothetical protein AGLY_007994 [Aphis glycines]|uniref:Uncharacterized protein n=1 Tax=Aphis glycines TaxID=307491 RepID=A0A6G0TLZ4_APHGL|nr:hypothetical protein AGLY_007994 [Aphis glycines]
MYSRHNFKFVVTCNKAYEVMDMVDYIVTNTVTCEHSLCSRLNIESWSLKRDIHSEQFNTTLVNNSRFIFMLVTCKINFDTLEPQRASLILIQNNFQSKMKIINHKTIIVPEYTGKMKSVRIRGLIVLTLFIILDIASACEYPLVNIHLYDNGPLDSLFGSWNNIIMTTDRRDQNNLSDLVKASNIFTTCKEDGKKSQRIFFKACPDCK